MTQQVSPFLESKYGWAFGETGWNTGMDENLLKFSFMFSGVVDEVVNSLPGAVSGKSVFLTSDNRFYFSVGTVWYSSPCPKWFKFTIKSTGQVYQFDGTSIQVIDSPTQLDSRIDAVEFTVSQLGTAAFEDVGYFATQSALDVVAAQSNAYTEQLANSLSSEAGSSLVGHGVTTVSAALDQVTPGIAGAVGDGIVDDTSAIFNLLVNSTAGGKVLFGEGLTYKLTGQLPVDYPLHIDLNGSTLEFVFDATLANGCGFAVQSDNVTIENGTIRVTGSTPGLASSAHVPIYGGREATGKGWENLVFRNLRLSTQGNGGIVFMGENRNVTVENIEIEDSPGIRLGVAFEWGGTPEVGTGHPHNITIRNIKAGSFTYPGEPSVNYTCVIWLSSVFNVTVENIVADKVPTVVNVFTGDKGNLYAPTAYKDIIGTSINVNNVTCNSVNGYGVRVYGKGTDSPTPLKQSVKLTNLTLFADPASLNTHMGVLLEFCDGVILENFLLDGFYYGIVTGADVHNLTVESGDVTNCALNGARVGSTGFPTINPVFKNVRFYSNNTQMTSSINTASAILLTDTRDATIEACHFGKEGVTETQVYSVYVTPASRRPKLNGNHTYALAAGGVAYVIGDSQGDTVVLASGENNTVEAGLLYQGGAPIFQINSFGVKSFTANLIPTMGTYSRGDRVYFDSPSASGYIGAVCVTAGAPGTWKNFGAIVT